MKKAVIVMLACLVIAGTAFAQADSLNVRFVGSWPFGESFAVAYDSVRELAFCGSGGGS